MMIKKDTKLGGIKLLCTKGVSILKIDDEKDKGIYFCWWKRYAKIKERNPLHCVMIRCGSDKKVVKFCEQNELRNIWHLSSEDDLFIIASLSVENEKSLLEVVKIVRGNIKGEKPGAESRFFKIEEKGRGAVSSFKRVFQLWIKKIMDNLN